MDRLVAVSLKNNNDQVIGNIAFPGRFAPLDGSLRTLEGGNQAVVLTAIDRSRANRPVVLKAFNLNDLSEGQAKELTREWQTLRLCKHPNIVTFVDVFIVEPLFYIVLEKMDCNLYDFMQFVLSLYRAFFEMPEYSLSSKEPGHNRLDVLAWIAIQLLRALEHLQELSIMHRDIKPKNIGWNKERCTVKLLDLGLSRIAKDGQDGLTAARGSKLYMAPELLFGTPSLRTYDCKVDLWSLFVTLCELPTRRPLFCPSDMGESDLKRGMTRICELPENSVLDRLGCSVDRHQENKPVVLKVFNLVELNEEQAKQLTREWQTLRLCKHPNIVSFVDVFVVKPLFYIVLEKMDCNLHDFIQKDPRHNRLEMIAWIAIQLLWALEHLQELSIMHRIVSFVDVFVVKPLFYIVLEKMDCNLHDFIQNNPMHNRLEVIAWIAIQLLWALEHLQELSIMHRDIKPKNIGFNFNQHQYTVKLLDLGFARIAKDGQEGLTEERGSRLYMAPELLFGGSRLSKVYDCKVDVWSLFVTLCEFPTRKPLFCPANSTVPVLMNGIIRTCGLPNDVVLEQLGYLPFNNYGAAAPTIREALPSTVFNTRNAENVEHFYDLLENVLSFDYKQRYSVQECLSHRFLQENNFHRYAPQKPEYKKILCDEVRAQGKWYENKG